MKQSWIDKKEKERLENIKSLTNKIRNRLISIGSYSDDEVDAFIDSILEKAECGNFDPIRMIPNRPSIIEKLKDNFVLLRETIDIIKLSPIKELSSIIRRSYSRYLDSSPKHYCGDIIITDPCYVIKDEDWEDFIESDEEESEMIVPNTIARSTIYGDWGCTTFDAVTKKPIGQFCADAGLVAVFDLSEVMKYNPEYNDPVDCPHAVTLIKDFDGDVWFEVKYSKRYDDYNVHVRGKGKNIRTGEPIEFITKQTGL